MTAVGGDFLLEPVDPGAAGVAELRDDGEKTLQTKERREEERTKEGGDKKKGSAHSVTWHAVTSGAPIMLSAPLICRLSSNSRGRG